MVKRCPRAQKNGMQLGLGSNSMVSFKPKHLKKIDWPCILTKNTSLMESISRFQSKEGGYLGEEFSFNLCQEVLWFAARSRVWKTSHGAAIEKNHSDASTNTPPPCTAFHQPMQPHIHTEGH